MNFLGAGIGMRKPYRDALLNPHEARPEVLEIIPAHFYPDPDLLEPLAEIYPLVFHAIHGAGTAGPDHASTMEHLQALVRRFSPALLTDHLAVTYAPNGTHLGHLAPIWYTREMLQIVVDRVKRWQDRFGVDIALETPTAPYLIPCADMEETEFFHALVEETGCGLLMDLTNIVTNARNFGFDPLQRMQQYPLHAVRQIHLAGGFVNAEPWWIDSHSETVDEGAYSLLRQLRGKAPLTAIIVERDDKLPPLPELVQESARASSIWRDAHHP